MSEQVPNIDPNPTPTEAPKPPPPAETSHLLSDIHKLKEANKNLQEMVKQRETDELKQKQEWKTLAELKEKENVELKEQISSSQKAILNNEKYKAVKDAAVKAGLRKEAMDDLESLFNYEQLQVEVTSTGRVNILGVDQAVERFKTVKAYLFGGPPPNVNLNTPGVTTQGPVNIGDLAKLEKEAKQSGDYSKYHAAVMEIKKKQA